MGDKTQFEQENDLGRGGGEVDKETMRRAWQTSAERTSTANVGDAKAGERQAEGQEELSGA